MNYHKYLNNLVFKYMKGGLSKADRKVCILDVNGKN
jgi:hypothetical protein